MQETEENRNETELAASNLFKKGISGNPNGRPVETPEKKALRKASKLLIEEYKQSLIDALPMISPVLISKALTGDVSAIKEVHDRTMDKAKQSTELTGKDGRELFTGLTDEEREKLNSLINAQ